MDASAWIALIAGIIGGGGISALGGYLLAGRNERKQDERAALREREALRETQGGEARSFQRDTLLELHDQLYKLNRNVGKSRHLDEMHYKATGEFGRQQLPEELSEEFTALLAGIHRLRVRIFDPELRDLVRKYIDALVSVSTIPRRDGDDAEARRKAMRIELDALKRFEPLQEQLGAAIRRQFPGSDLTALSLPDPSGRPNPEGAQS